MSSHIRYRGFQGNIRQLTPPISFAAELQAILSLLEFEPWRQAGGVMVTDALGVPAVRKYYDPQLQSFPHKRVAQEAFLAGNDLLVLSQFALTDVWADQFENIKSTIAFFRDKYVSDSKFQAQVDQSLARILRLKHGLHPEFSLEEVQVDAGQLTGNVAQGYDQVSQIAEEAVTLIYPGPGELADRLPSPPLLEEKILIFTDDRQAQDCYDCPPFYFIKPDALEETIRRLYGPEASGQIDPAQIRSLTFSQLKGYLGPAGPEGSTEYIAPLLEEADWIIFAMLDVNLDDYPDSDAVKLFLKQLSDSLRNKKIVVLAYNAPYYLDTTEISKLTAYYGIYSKVPAFIDASVRALFREFTLQGALPVTVQGINYDLILRMEPDPDQVIEIMPTNASMEGTPTEETPGSIGVEVGDTLELQTSIIKDENGHPVPDGTPVVFRFFYPAETLELPRLETITVNGIAEAAIKLERTGQLEITVASGPALKSITLIVAIEGDEPATIATVVPTVTATPTVTPTPIPTHTATPIPPTPTATSPPPQPTAEVVPPEASPTSRRVGVGAFLLSLVATFVVGGAGYALRRNEDRSPTQGLKAFLWVLICGTAGYIAYGLGWPGAGFFLRLSRHWGAPLMSLVFSLFPVGVIWVGAVRKGRARPSTQ
jgi:beta-N-acetylhexosaminidase